MNTPSTFFDGIDTTIAIASSSGATIHSIGGYVVHEWTGSATVPTHTGNFTPATTAKYEFFMVGYGGDGEDEAGGGGGGGEVVLGSITLQSGSTYSVQVGNNNQSDPSRFASVYAYGGGRAGRGGNVAEDGQDGASGGAGTGGSGGGGGDASGDTKHFGGDSFSTNGLLDYLFRYGNDGGDSAADDGAGGGGGAGSRGDNGSQDGSFNPLGGDGGDAITNNWLGSTLYYGGGGGGFPGGNGGNGAGNAADTTNGNAQSAVDFSGGGGGGSENGNAGGGANGIVLVRYKLSV